PNAASFCGTSVQHRFGTSSMSPTVRLPNEEQSKIVTEDQFVTRDEKLMRSILPGRLVVRRGASLLYEVTVDHRLEIRADPKRPSRGHAAFQTDLVRLRSSCG